MLQSILGGAAIYRCGGCPVFIAALAAEGQQFSKCATTQSFF
jgi:hypothetical protein